MTQLLTRVLGRRLARFESLDSSSSEAAREAGAGEAEGLVVLAGEQTAGRGRFGRRWHSPRGGLWFSVLLRPRLEHQALRLIPLAAALSMARAVEAASGTAPRIRWPNDLLLGGRKLAGILCEVVAGEALVLGVGLNLAVDVGRYPAEVAARSVSLSGAGGRVPGELELLTGFLNDFEPVYFKLGDAAFRMALLEEVRGRMEGLGAMVSVSLPGGSQRLAGRALDLEPDGALILETADGLRRRILSGDLEI